MSRPIQDKRRRGKTRTKAVVVAVLSLVLFSGQARAAVYRSSELGWTAGQDVSTDFANFLSNTFQAGDELRLEHTYQISGTHQLPDDFILSAVIGAGFDVTDVVSDVSRQFLRLGNRNTLRNLTITYLNTPPLGPNGTNPVVGVDFYPMIGITGTDKSDIRIEYCGLYGSINHHLKIVGGSRIEIIGCHIMGGYWSSYLAGDVTDVTYQFCVIEQAQGDGIKTGRGGPFGVSRVLVDTCLFQDNGRDGIDTTGGFLDSTVRNTTMRRVFSGMDIKSYFESAQHLSEDCSNTNIRVESSRFTDMGSAIVLSTIDRGLQYNDGVYFLTPETAQIHAPHDVELIDCIFERTGAQEVRMLLAKGGHTVRYQNSQFWGEGIEEVRLTHVFDTFGPDTLSEEVSDALNHTINGTLGATGLADAPGETSVPFDYGPQENDVIPNQDAGTGGGDDNSSNGCGCTGSPPQGGLWPWILILLTVWRLRNRRRAAREIR